MSENLPKIPSRLLGITPLIVFLVVYLCSSILQQDFYAMPLGIAFVVTAIYAFVITPGSVEERTQHFSRGAADSNIIMMIWIFILAGAFAEGTKSIGGIDAMVTLILYILPPNLLLPSIFIASCLISLSIGTSVGTIVTLSPIVFGFAENLDISPAYLVAIVVGGAFFGDNLSFISDTTIAATRSQGVNMRDKFLVNIRIALPATILALIIYSIQGQELVELNRPETLPSIWLILPYLIVLVCAVAGMNVLFALIIGLISCACLTLSAESIGFWGWLGEVGKGINDMGELIIVTLLAGGVLELIRINGGIAYLTDKLTQYFRGRCGGEFVISILVFIINACTANNTIAILMAGRIARQISDHYGIDRRRSASLLDTFSCVAQGILPYGAQLLLAAKFASVSPLDIIPYMYYPFLLGAITVLSIIFNYPRLKGHPSTEASTHAPREAS